jgi:sialic acid synthase SpsE
MKIGAFDTHARVLVVAEIGNNHEGDFTRARQMVQRAADCGVDAVKFQTLRAVDLVRRSDAERFARLERFELSDDQFRVLADEAHRRGLLFISTPLSLAAVDLLDPLVDAFKIASGDNDFVPLLTRVAATGKPTIVSTGVSEVEQIAAAVNVLREAWRENSTKGELALLHCVSAYPTPVAQTNLRSIPFLWQQFGCTVGYSDHTLGIEAAVLSVAAGARIIEKHFTLDKRLSDFRDHALSADPPETAELVRRVREAEQMLGAWGKPVQPSEAAAAQAIRRSIAAARDLRRGTRLALADLKWVRPADGLPPGAEQRLVGKTLSRDVSADESLTERDVQ